MINTSEEAKEAIGEQVKILQKALDAFPEILASVNKITPSTQEAHSFMESVVNKKDLVMGKSDNASEIAEKNSAAIEEVAASSEELSASSEEIATAAQTLGKISKNLIEKVKYFKI